MSTTISYQTTPISDPLSQGERRLFTFGILLVILGSFCAFAALTLILPNWLMTAYRPGPAVRSTPPPGLSATWWIPPFLLLAALATLFIWTGIASIKMRRWVRPIIISFAGLFIFSTVVVLLQLLIAWIIDLYLGTPPPPNPSAVFRGPSPFVSPQVVQAVFITLMILFGIGAPLLFLLAYRSRPVELALDEHDPRVAWTDRAPIPVFALAVALAWTGLLSLLGFIASPVPYFINNPSELINWVFWIGLALLLVATARAVYSQHPIGPWLAIILVVAIAASTLLAATASIDNQAELRRRRIGGSYSSIDEAKTIPLAALVTSLAYVLPAVGYILYARGKFEEK